MSPEIRLFTRFLLLACAGSAAACSTEEPKVAAAPILGVLELPISHRNGDPEPTGAAKVEVSPGEIRVDGESVITLQNGKIPPAEASGYILPKLKAKLTGKGALAI